MAILGLEVQPVDLLQIGDLLQCRGLEWGFVLQRVQRDPSNRCLLAAALHYQYLPVILERIEAAAPAGADLASWRY